MVHQRKQGFQEAFLEEVEFRVSGTDRREVVKLRELLEIKMARQRQAISDIVNKLVCSWTFIGADAKGNTNLGHNILVFLFAKPTLSSFKADNWAGNEAPVL